MYILTSVLQHSYNKKRVTILDSLHTTEWNLYSIMMQTKAVNTVKNPFQILWFTSSPYNWEHTGHLFSVSTKREEKSHLQGIKSSSKLKGLYAWESTNRLQP
jgi:hypothetical protein